MWLAGEHRGAQAVHDHTTEASRGLFQSVELLATKQMVEGEQEWNPDQQEDDDHPTRQTNRETVAEPNKGIDLHPHLSIVPETSAIMSGRCADFVSSELMSTRPQSDRAAQHFKRTHCLPRPRWHRAGRWYRNCCHSRGGQIRGCPMKRRVVGGMR